LAAGAVLVLAALGAVGLASRAGGASPAGQPDKPANELEALRKENELLKLNLQVVLEKVRAQENELRPLREQAARQEKAGVNRIDVLEDIAHINRLYSVAELTVRLPHDPLSDATKEAESAVKALREAKDKDAQRRAAEALDKAMKKLREQLK